MLETLVALAEPNRLRIVEALRAKPHSVGELSDRFGIRQPQVSKHLNTLKAAGLVAVRAEAQRRIYALEPKPFQELDRWLESYRTLWAERYSSLGEVIQEIQRKKRGTK
ncbi:MAG TPA: metalloregulator ArsR/SmtB family transcription factor [Polyangiaceae bacterium]|nr:metalloregulator ArsR/SmtB family transcription factor [Polyangiaceae bacterium]